MPPPQAHSASRMFAARLSRNMRLKFLAATIVTLLLCSLPLSGQPQAVAPSPPMGWNSWDSYGELITEAQVRATADVMAKQLKAFGWQYVVIDEGWYLLDP